ncbi:MAG: hypothetical protein MHM6MM_000588 [Cercozoa sp. M6MM]
MLKRVIGKAVILDLRQWLGMTPTAPLSNNNTLAGYLVQVAAFVGLTMFTVSRANALGRRVSEWVRSNRWQRILKTRFFGASTNPTIFSQCGSDVILEKLGPEERCHLMAQILMPASSQWVPSKDTKLTPESAHWVTEDEVETFQSLWSQLLHCENPDMLCELRKICNVKTNSALKFRLGTLYAQSLREVINMVTALAKFDMALRLLSQALTMAPTMLHCVLATMPRTPRRVTHLGTFLDENPDALRAAVSSYGGMLNYTACSDAHTLLYRLDPQNKVLSVNPTILRQLLFMARVAPELSEVPLNDDIWKGLIGHDETCPTRSRFRPSRRHLSCRCGVSIDSLNEDVCSTFLTDAQQLDRGFLRGCGVNASNRTDSTEFNGDGSDRLIDAVVPPFYFVFHWPDRHGHTDTLGSDFDDECVAKWFSQGHEFELLREDEEVRRAHLILHRIRAGNLLYLSKTLTLRRMLRRILEHAESAAIRHFGNPHFCPSGSNVSLYSSNKKYVRQGMRISTWYACLHWLSGQDKQRVLSRMLQFATPDSMNEATSELPTVSYRNRVQLLPMLTTGNEQRHLFVLLQSDGPTLGQLAEELNNEIFDPNAFDAQHESRLNLESRQLIAKHLRTVLRSADTAVARVARKADKLVDKFDDVIRLCVRSAVLTLHSQSGAADLPDDVLDCVCEFVFPVKAGAKQQLTSRSSSPESVLSVNKRVDIP